MVGGVVGLGLSGAGGGCGGRSAFPWLPIPFNPVEPRADLRRSAGEVGCSEDIAAPLCNRRLLRFRPSI